MRNVSGTARVLCVYGDVGLNAVKPGVFETASRTVRVWRAFREKDCG